MVRFRQEPDRIIATYSADYSGSIQWIEDYFKHDAPATINKTYTFSKDILIPRLITGENEEDFDEPEPMDFLFAKREGDYYKVVPGVLTEKMDVFIAPDFSLSKKVFVAEKDTAVFGQIEALIDEDVYLGGSHPEAISEELFLSLMKQFPNAYEVRLYVQARLSTALSNYFTTTKDVAIKFNNYRNKKASKTGVDVLKTFKEVELVKYQAIYDKLVAMLKEENKYSEDQWQNEILQIIRLLYPKYLQAFKSVPISAG